MKYKILALSLLASFVTSASVENSELLQTNTKTAQNIVKSNNDPLHGWHGGCLFINGVRQYCILK